MLLKASIPVYQTMFLRPALSKTYICKCFHGLGVVLFFFYMKRSMVVNLSHRFFLLYIS